MGNATVIKMQKDIKKSENSLMTEGSIWKKILFFSIPLILGNLLQQMYNTVDSIIVGNYVGSNALAAVGASTFIINLLIAFSMGISTGAGVVVAQCFGAGKKQRVHLSVHTAIAISIILGLILSLIGVIYTPQILVWMGTPEEIMGDSVTYLKVYSAGLIFSVIYNMGAGILNAVGNSKQPLIYLGIASFLNIILDLFFIDKLKMGIIGAAIATDISQITACFLILFFLIKVPESYQLNLKKIKINGGIASRILKISFPAGIQNTVISFSNVLVQSSINIFGAKAIAGVGAYMKIDGFNILPVLSFSLAMTTFTGQNFGAGKIDRIKKGIKVTIAMGMIYSALTGVLLLFFSESFLRIFTSDREIIRYGVEAMKYFCPFYFLLSLMQILAGVIRGTGKTVPPMIILLIAMCIFRIIWLQFILPRYFIIETIYALYPASWFLGTVLMFLYIWKGNWLEKRKK